MDHYITGRIYHQNNMISQRNGLEFMPKVENNCVMLSTKSRDFTCESLCCHALGWKQYVMLVIKLIDFKNALPRLYTRMDVNSSQKFCLKMYNDGGHNYDLL